MFSRNFKKIPTKISFKKSDGAPMIFFIDVIKSKSFLNPILPMPSRIDMLSNGYPTQFILPRKQITVEVGHDFYTYDYEKLYLLFLQNLVFYSKQKYQEITYRKLEKKILEKWWNKSLYLNPKIPSYYRDIEFILRSYLNAFKKYKETDDENSALLEYCQDMIDYCNMRLKANKIEIIYKDKLIEKRMYKEKRNHFFPDIFEYDYLITNTNKIQRKAFVPIVIYDDMLECFLFNKIQIEKLMENKKKDQNKDKEIITSNSDNLESDEKEVFEIISFEHMLNENIILKIAANKKVSIDSIEIVKNLNFNEIISINRKL